MSEAVNIRQWQRYGYSAIQILFVAALWLLLFPMQARAQVHPDTTVHRLLTEGIADIVNEDFGEAEETFAELRSYAPENPLGLIYGAAVDIVRSFELVTPYPDSAITTMLEEAVEQAEDLIDEDDENPWHYYYKGLSLAYAGYYYALQRDYLDAFTVGFDAVLELEEAAELDTSFIEADVAVATFDYWRSRKADFLNWLPFVEDDRTSAVEVLERALLSPSYNAHLAANSLVWIYIDYDMPEKAVALCESVLEAYPGSMTFRRALGRAWEDIDRQKAISIYTTILDAYIEKENGSDYYIGSMMHKIAQNQKALGNYESALDWCERFLRLDTMTKYEQQRLTWRRNRVLQLKQELTSLDETATDR